MSDQQSDPWATVSGGWVSSLQGQVDRVVYDADDVDAARAEMERRHAEALKVKDTEHQRHFEIMQQTQNLASSIMGEQRTQIANITSERNAANARLAEVESERDKAEAEVEDLKAAHEAALAAVGRSHAQALEKLRAEHAAALKAKDERIARWEGDGGLHAAIAELNGYGPDWPSHGNAPLAIAANYALLKTRAEAAEAERDTLRAQFAAVQSDYKRGFFDGFAAAQSWGCDAVQEAYSDYAGEPLTLKEPKS